MPVTQSRTHTYEYGNVTIVVHRPALEENERIKREATRKTALAGYGKALARSGRGEPHVPKNGRSCS